jgi:hypothetical protein
MKPTFVPPDFDIPLGFEGPGFHLEPLGPIHNERDHQAWMSSIDHIKSTPGFEDSDWPAAMSLEANMSDLVMHATDFENRSGFTYSVLDGADVIGCIYIYPSVATDHDVKVTSWVRQNRSEMDVVVWRAVSDWIETKWPFARPRYAAREDG